MSDAAPENPPPPKRKFKRWQLLALLGVVLLGAAAFAALRMNGTAEPEEGADKPNQVVYPIKRKPEPPKLGVEYHYDRNAIVDSRMVGSTIVGLAAAGNLVEFGADNYSLRAEKVPRRRATCLGPADKTHVLVGIANGSIVRAAVDGLSFQQVAEVPGIPRWIGRQGKAGKEDRDGALVVAYQPERSQPGKLLLFDTGTKKDYDVGAATVFFLDSKQRVWIASGERIDVLDLTDGARKEVPWKGGWQGVRGFAELSDGQIWAFGGTGKTGEMGSFVARLSPGGKPVLVHGSGGKKALPSAPGKPVTHVIEALDPARVIVVCPDNVLVSDANLTSWKPLDAMVGGHREEDALWATGQAHGTSHGVILSLARGGFMEVTFDFTRRHVLEGQNIVQRPSEIVRLADGMAFYGAGGPLFFANGGWHPLPDPILPPAELMGLARAGEKERLWAAMLTIPIEGGASYVIAKAGPPRRYVGHMHGLRDVFLTARWDGQVLTVLGREELPIEPDDTFATPDRQLWNVDDQGLWSFAGGHWHLVMRLSSMGAGGGKHGANATGAKTQTPRSLGDGLRFAESSRPPFYGLPVGTASWSLLRLDTNEAGGVPLMDEVPVVVGNRRLRVFDLTVWGNRKEELLLATDSGLCAFNVKFGTCELARPDSLDDDVTLFMRDGTKRLWMAGGGLWVLRDLKHADEIHSSLPMLADTRVVALAEAPDGRLVVGSEDRGVVFVTIPQGWFQRPAEPLRPPEPWDGTRAYEPGFMDNSVVVRACPGKSGGETEAATSALVTALREFARSAGPRVRVTFEDTYEGGPDIAVRGPDLEKLVQGTLSVTRKLSLGKTGFSVSKRFGPRGSAGVELESCPVR